jgi:hypothetical protein
MLSEFSRKAKRATVLTGTVAAAALLMGAGAANALLIDNFGGRHFAGIADLGAIASTDSGFNIGFASVTAFTQAGSIAGSGFVSQFPANDAAGGAANVQITTPCAGAGIGGDFAWCIGGTVDGLRSLTINARNDTGLTASINMTDSGTLRPDGAFRMTDNAGGGNDAYGESTLFYGRDNGAGGEGPLSPKMDLLVKEHIDSNIYGTDPDGAAGYLTQGHTTLGSFGVDGINGNGDDGTDAEKAAEVGMWGFIIDALNIDKADTQLDIVLTTDAAVDLGAGAGTSHSLVFELPAVSADPLGQEIFVPFLDFLTVDSEATRLALITALTGIRSVQFQFGGPLGIVQNQIAIDNIRTGMQNLPEPGTLAVMGMGLIGLGIARRRRKQAA